jgi:hypothetical protein
MNCCDAAGNCNQGRDCPARKTCRQRAGQPADYNKVELWIKDTDAMERELERQWRSDLKSIVFIAACILSFFLLVWGTL